MNYPYQLLVPIYRFLLKLSRNRGLKTLARLDVAVFNRWRKIPISKGSSLKLVLPPNDHFFGFLLGNHEEHIHAAIEDYLPSGGTYVDVGANIGYFCVVAAEQLGPQGSIHAFEPNRANYQNLRRNKRSIGKAAHVTTYKAGLSNRSGTAELSIGPHSTYHSFEKTFASGKTETVRITTLDRFVKAKKITRVDLMKIDVEGHELGVLAGATESLKAGIFKTIVLECRDQEIRDAIPSFCHKFGFYPHVWNGSKWMEYHGKTLEDSVLDCLLRLRA